MIDQIVRRRRRRIPGEIPLCADQRKTLVGTDPYRDHVLRKLFAEAHARVVAIRRNVAHGVVADQFNLGVGVLRKELQQLWPEDCLDRIVHRRDADGSAGFVPKLAQCLDLGIDLGHLRRDVLVLPLAGLRRRDIAGRPCQQSNAEIGF
ncbi:hypothetical protein G6F65_020358 [Rhizopus arrhizus]|nr:hypothetical protein G6F65_020358 [Rhizopus arrhizus]